MQTDVGEGNSIPSSSTPWGTIKLDDLVVGSLFASDNTCPVCWAHDGPGAQGLSRKAILEQIHASLARLGTDYVDLYQIHRFDPNTPVEETMEARATRSGPARQALSRRSREFDNQLQLPDSDGVARWVAN